MDGMKSSQILVPFLVLNFRRIGVEPRVQISHSSIFIRNVLMLLDSRPLYLQLLNCSLIIARAAGGCQRLLEYLF
jgi:hypothetical protein